MILFLSFDLEVRGNAANKKRGSGMLGDGGGFSSRSRVLDLSFDLHVFSI